MWKNGIAGVEVLPNEDASFVNRAAKRTNCKFYF